MKLMRFDFVTVEHQLHLQSIGNLGSLRVRSFVADFLTQEPSANSEFAKRRINTRGVCDKMFRHSKSDVQQSFSGSPLFDASDGLISITLDTFEYNFVVR